MTINEIGLKNKLGPDFEGYDRADKEKDRLLRVFSRFWFVRHWRIM